jgi:hypothetical protein
MHQSAVQLFADECIRISGRTRLFTRGPDPILNGMVWPIGFRRQSPAIHRNRTSSNFYIRLIFTIFVTISFSVRFRLIPASVFAICNWKAEHLSFVSRSLVDASLIPNNTSDIGVIKSLFTGFGSIGDCARPATRK